MNVNIHLYMPTQLSLYHIVYKNISMYISLYKSMSLIYSSCDQKTTTSICMI